MRAVKRLLDVVAALGLLLFLAPLLLILAALVRLGSPGPALFRQQRIGLGLRPFWLLKFRSMVADAAAKGSWFTPKDDPRVTRIGRFLRKTSLDELPQLLNVLKGEMSLVGPRPDVPEQMALYTEEERRLRHSVRPGLTGWAQVNGRNEIDSGRRKELDLEYARKWTLLLDAKILFLTVRQVLVKGSY